MASKKSIVLIDDDFDILELLQEYIHLSLPHVGVLAFEDPHEALSYITGGAKVDLIVSDQTMPGFPGLRLLAAVVGAGYEGHFFLFSSDISDSMAFELLKLETSFPEGKVKSKVVLKMGFEEIIAEIKAAFANDGPPEEDIIT